MEVQRVLLGLLLRLSPTIDLITPDQTPASFDYHCPLMSLPLAFRTTLETIPVEPRYLHSEAALRSANGLMFFGDELDDFSDTAALVDLMDLVISVDTGVAHLAGALGKPVWVLLPFSPDWRWLLNRDDSPWYSSVKLFRQSRVGDWAGVIDQVMQTLSQVEW